MSGFLQSPWVLATRPKTLPAALSPVGMGLAWSYYIGQFSIIPAFLTVLTALLIQIGTNFANDYFDFKKGTDTADRLGPTRMTQSGQISPDAMKRAFYMTFFAAFIGGLGLVWMGGFPILAIGIASIVCGYLYTGGPWPLGYIGAGDVVAFAFFGPIAVAGTVYLQTLTWSIPALILGIGPGLFSMAILTVNNLRDVVQDRQAGKKSLVVRFGMTWGRWEYYLSIGGAWVVPIYLVYIGAAPPLVLLGLASFLKGIRPMKSVALKTGSDLNPALGETAQTLLLYSLGIAIGLLWP